MKNVFYFSHINSIGGVESWLYYISQLYGDDFNIDIYYQTGDIKQIQRLREKVRVHKYYGQKIKCDKAFFCYNLDIIDNVEANEYCQFLHGDYKALNVMPNRNNKITKYYAVSELVRNTFKEITGIDSEVIYNPIELDDKKILHLISATRLTKEKGRERIIKFANKLNESDIPFEWTIYTDDEKKINLPNIKYESPTLDIVDKIRRSDYLVQLSDSESYCYSVVESLMVGIPVIVTDMPIMKEIGVKDGINGFILDFDLNNLDVDKIYNANLKFGYKPPKSDFSNILVKGKSEEMKNYKVRAKIDFEDLEEKKQRTQTEEFLCTKERYEYLSGKNENRIVAVELVEIKENKENDTTVDKKEDVSKNKVVKKNIHK